MPAAWGALPRLGGEGPIELSGVPPAGSDPNCPWGVDLGHRQTQHGPTSCPSARPSRFCVRDSTTFGVPGRPMSQTSSCGPAAFASVLGRPLRNSTSMARNRSSAYEPRGPGSGTPRTALGSTVTRSLNSVPRDPSWWRMKTTVKPATMASATPTPAASSHWRLSSLTTRPSPSRSLRPKAPLRIVCQMLVVSKLQGSWTPPPSGLGEVVIGPPWGWPRESSACRTGELGHDRLVRLPAGAGDVDLGEMKVAHQCTVSGEARNTCDTPWGLAVTFPLCAFSSS